MIRQEVYTLIDGERDYQDQTPPIDGGGTAQAIMSMRILLNEAATDLYLRDNEEALGKVREIAATAVRCMEACGAPAREDTVREMIRTLVQTCDGCVFFPRTYPLNRTCKQCFDASHYTKPPKDSPEETSPNGD